jgi:hypothetical protein
MRILILHRIPYHKIDYHLGIDHDRHDVCYIGTEKSLATIPASLPCKQLLRPGIDRASDEVIAIIKSLDITFDRVLSLSEYELLDAARVRSMKRTPASPTGPAGPSSNRSTVRRAKTSWFSTHRLR